MNKIDDIFNEVKKKKKIEKKGPTREEQREEKVKKDLKKQWRLEEKARKLDIDSGYLRVEGGIKIYSE